MKQRIVIAIVTTITGVALALMGFAFGSRGAAAAAQGAVVGGAQVADVPGAEPVTSSSNWKQLSDDVGVMLRKDDRLGHRARLFVRINDVWLPVATDGIADVLGTVPAR